MTLERPISETPLRICVTGAAGQIAYSLIPSISDGKIFGLGQKIILHLLDIEPMMSVLKGLQMELEDCTLSLLQEVIITSDPHVAFKDVDAAFLIGAMPRKEGMTRRDLLQSNVKIFKEQGKALDQVAKKTVKIVVVGNPANTNCLICMQYASSIPRENFSCLTRLDQNRAVAMISQRLKVNPSLVKNVIIWGNHSSTQYPDVRQAYLISDTKQARQHQKRPLSNIPEIIHSETWLRTDFIKSVQERGSAVIAARKLSSAMSAAKAIVDHMHDWWHGTAEGEIVSMGVYSDGSYDIKEGIIFSYPVTIHQGRYTIYHDIPIDAFSREKMDISAKELFEEREEAMKIVQENSH